MAYDISTISLKVDLSSTKDVEAKFNALVKTLEAKKVKLEVDTSSLQASLKLATSEIEKSYSKIKDTVKKANDEIAKPVKSNNSGISELEKQISSAEKTISKFTETKNKQLNNILAGNSGTMVPNLTEYDKLVTKMNELKNIKLDSTNVDTYTKNVKEVQTAYDELTTKIKQVNSTSKEMNSSVKMDSDIVNKVRNYNTQLEVMRQKNADIINNPIYQQIANDVNKLSQANQPLRQLSNETNTIDNNMKQLRASMTQVGNMGNVFTKLGQSIKSAFSFMSASMVFYQIANQIRALPNEIRKLDTAFVDLKKTTSMSTEELDEFYKSSNEIAKQLGVTTEGIINQASAWSRLGYSTKEQAETMAQVSAIFSSISPEMDMDTATDGLVSAMKAFGISADEALDGIASKINMIGNTQAVNNEDIVDFLTRSSSAMAEANNTLDETIALGTAAVEITRDAASVGNVLKTTSMRIRGYSEETEAYTEDVEVLSGTIADLTKTASTPGGISLFTDETKETYKSTYQILKEIDGIYDQISDRDQASLLEALSGKRNGQTVAAILNNFEAVESSLESMTNSQGNAMEEMEVIYDSIDYKMNRLKETWVGLAQGFLERDTFKGLVDSLTDILNIINSLGGITSILTTILGLVVLIKSESIAAFAGTMIGSMKKLASVVGLVSTGYMNLGGAMAALNINPMIAGFTAIVAVLGAVKFATDKAKQAHEDYISSLEEKANKTQNELDAVKELKDKYKELYETTNRTEEQNKELLSVQNDLITSLGLEKGAIDASKQSWDELSNSIDTATKKKIEYALQQQNDLVKDAQESLTDEFNNNNIKGRFIFDQDAFVTDDARKQAKSIIEQVNEELGKEVAKISDGGAGIQLFNVDNEEEYYEVLRKIQEVTQNGDFDDYWNSKNYESISSEITRLDGAFSDLDEKTKKKYELQIALDMPDLLNELDIEDVTNVTKTQAEALKKSFSDLFSEEDKLQNAEYIQYFNDRVDSIIANKDAIDALSVSTQDSTSTFEDIANSMNSASESVDILSTSLTELQNQGTLSEDTMGKLSEQYPKIFEGCTTAAEGIAALNTQLTTNKFDETTNSISDLTSILKNLQDGNILTKDSFDKINESFPDLLGYIDDEKALMDAVITKTDEYKEKQIKAYNDMLMANDSYYQQKVLADTTWVQTTESNLNGLISSMGSNYNVDLDNYSNMEKAKIGVTTELVKSLGQIWASYFSKIADGMSIGDIEESMYINGDESLGTNMNYDAYNQAKKLHDSIQKMGDSFKNIDVPDFNSVGTKSSSGSKSSSSEKYAEYIDSIYDSILNSLQEGTDKVDRQIAISQSKLENLELFGKQEDVTTATSDLEKLYQDRIDIMKKSSSQMVSIRNKMAKELQATGYEEIKGLDLTNISQLGVDKIIKNLEKQIDSANNSSDSKLAASLTYKKNLIEDYTGNIINANSEINSMAKDIIDAQNELGNAVIDNIKRVTELDKQRYDDKLKLIELEQISLDEDSSEYKAKEQEKINMLIELQKGYQATITQLKAQGKTNDQEDVREYVNLYTDAEIEILNLKKSMAEKERQLQIKASQDMVTDLEAQKKALEERTNLVMDMIKKEQELRKKAINEEIDGYEKIIEARKKSITDEQDEAGYNEELSEKQKVVTDLESKLLALQNDNSESAKAQRLKLEEELSTAKKDLNKLQLDKQTDDRLDALDEELEAFKDEKQEELDEIEDYLSKSGQIRSDAMKRIEQEGKSLYNSLKAYNSEYGSMAETELEELWTTATTSVNGYIDSNKSLLEIMKEITAEINKQTTLQGKLEDDSWQTFVPDTDNNTSSSTSNNKNLDTIQRMKDNSAKWSSSSKDEQKKLSEENQKLGSKIGAYYDSTSGNWYVDSTKKRKLYDTIGIYHSGGIAGKNMSTGNVSINPNTEIFSKLMIGEPITTQLQASNFINKSLPTLIKAGSGNAEITLNISKLIDVDKIDANTDIEDVTGRAVKEVMKQLKTNLSNIGLRPNLR